MGSCLSIVDPELLWQRPAASSSSLNLNRNIRNFACVSMASEKREFFPTAHQFLKHPLALFALVPKFAALFAAGAKTVTAPLDRIKLLMQVIRIIPYSAVQLFAYEAYKKLLTGKDGQLSVIGRLAAGACAGMTSTFVTYPLDVLRLRLAVEPGYKTMTQVALNMLKEEGVASFYNGLGPSLIGIAPYMAVNFCVFDLAKKALPENYQKRTETSLITGLISATVATVMCYPLDTVRRQMQMRGTPYKTVMDAFQGIVERDGVVGLYRGFVPNALKTLPTSSTRLTTFDSVKRLIAASEKELQRVIEGNRKKERMPTASSSSN